MKYIGFCLFILVVGFQKEAYAKEESEEGTEEAVSSSEETNTQEPQEKVEETSEVSSSELKPDPWDPKVFHETTPTYLADKLVVGFGLGLGGGSDSSKKLDQDVFGYHLFALYPVEKLALVPNAKTVAGVFYRSFTGVEMEKKKLAKQAINVGVQTFGGGLGLEWEVRKVRVITFGQLGIVKTMRVAQDKTSLESSKYSIAVEGQALARRPLLEKIDVYAGLGLHVGRFSRIGIETGLMGTF